MNLLNLAMKKNALLTPDEYLKLFKESPNSIESVSMKMPRLGKDNHFGLFEVTFAHDYYEVSLNAK